MNVAVKSDALKTLSDPCELPVGFSSAERELSGCQAGSTVEDDQ